MGNQGARKRRSRAHSDKRVDFGIPRLASEEAREPRRRLSPRRQLRYLVTGGAGFIGSHLVDALVSRGDPVVVLDDLSTGRVENLRGALNSNLVEFVEGSVLDEETVEGCMREVDVCLHLASVVGVRLVVEQPLDSLLLNARGADTVLTVAARKRRRLLFASTSEVYGKNSGQNLDEDADRILGSARKARWGYALAKSVGEFLASQLYREYDAEMVVVRLFNTVGPRQSDSYGMVLPRFVRQALRGESLTVYGDGAQSRCFTHVTDTVEALLRLTDAEPATGGIFNVGTRDAVPIIELAKRVIERTDSRSTITSVPYRQALGADFEELGQRIPDTSAIHSLVGWRPTRSIDEAIDDVVAEQRSAESVHVLA